MSKPNLTLIEALLAQHRALEAEVASLEAALSTADLVRTRSALDNLRDGLEAHFQLEQSDFYSPLFERTQADLADPLVHQVVSLFHTNFIRIADGCRTFFRRWNKPLTTEQLPALRADWLAAHHGLSSRLQHEEVILHPIFRRFFP